MKGEDEENGRDGHGIPLPPPGDPLWTVHHEAEARWERLVETPERRRWKALALSVNVASASPPPTLRIDL